jgi:hypothetical protein
VNASRSPASLEEIEALVRRFNERVDGALLHAEPSKGWTRNALTRRGAPRCPIHLRELSYDIILRHGDVLAEMLAGHPSSSSIPTSG